VDSVSACQNFVKTTIKAPSWFTKVELNWQFNEKTWVVIGHLDYGFGTPVRGEYMCSMDISDDKWAPRGIRIVGSDNVAGTIAMDTLKRYPTDKNFRAEVDPNHVDPLPQFERYPSDAIDLLGPASPPSATDAPPNRRDLPVISAQDIADWKSGSQGWRS
jgi:hypothetical protein